MEKIIEVVDSEDDITDVLDDALFWGEIDVEDLELLFQKISIDYSGNSVDVMVTGAIQRVLDVGQIPQNSYEAQIPNPPKS